MIFSAPPGRVVISLDFSNQEAQIAAVWSGDEMMCNVFRVPEKLTDKDGKEYVNPYSDLHTLTCVACVAPEDYKGVPESKWRDIADSTGKRKPAKILNFGILFGSTALAISELNHVPIKVAEEWVTNHKKTYHRFHQWADEYGHIAQCRGFAIAPVVGHHRWVN
jgi:DNA polymerase I-like protein with 3'-5' exonuclease and polymerase domains